MRTSQALGGVIGVGYEGRVIGDFVSELTAAGVTVLVDVRELPLSRKPGFSKTALAEALRTAGIEYVHLRALGNPKPNRSGFSGSPVELSGARERYRTSLRTEPAERALDHLADLARENSVAVMCFEADQHRCHRDVVLDELTRRSTITSSGSTRRAH